MKIKTYIDFTSGVKTRSGMTGVPKAKIPPPSPPARQCPKEFGAIPCDEIWEMMDILCLPSPIIPSSVLSV